MRHPLLLLLPLLILGLSGCNPSPEAFEYRNINGNGWAADSLTTFQLHVEDTTSQHNLYFYVQHNQHYPNANLYLYIEVTAPDGSTQHDTMNYHLASPTGEWYGRGLTHNREILLPYILGTRFTQLGNYTLTLQHGMRYEHLQGILTVGYECYTAE